MQRLVWWIQWHRRLGVVVAVLVFLLAVTGILINHSQQMGWHQAPVYSSLLARWYHIPVPALENGFAAGEHWIVARGEQVLLDRQAVAECTGGVQGATRWQDMIAVLCSSELLLLDAQGQLVESVRGLPEAVSALALPNGQLVARGAGAQYVYDDAAGVWNVAPETPQWLQAQPLPQALREALNANNPVPGLTRERVLLDLHSGRLFGNAGVLVVDLVGVAICLLAFSGALTWVGRYYKKWRRRHH